MDYKNAASKYDGSAKSVKTMQAQYLADLQNELKAAEAKTKRHYLRAERQLFLVSLIEARQAQKLSQSELAAKLKTKQSVISRIENGHGNPSLNTLLAIAKALQVNLVLE